MNDADEVTRVEPEKKRGGTWITFGCEAYRVPPLAFASIQELQDRISGLASMGANGQPSKEQMATVLDVVHAALTRNYPSIKREDVAEMVDLANYQEVLGAVLNVAGFREREPGESGEARALTGAQSTSP